MSSCVDLRSHPQFAAIMAAFEARYMPEPMSGCWLWTGNYFSMQRMGYGCFTMRPARMMSERAHRLAWKLHNGPISQEQHVLHRCDNPVCVNPWHLFLGDQTANMEDRHRKGRHNYGETHGKVKLTENQVRAIHADTRLYSEIAADHSITFITVCDIKTGRSWCHLGLPRNTRYRQSSKPRRLKMHPIAINRPA